MNTPTTKAERNQDIKNMLNHINMHRMAGHKLSIQHSPHHYAIREVEEEGRGLGGVNDVFVCHNSFEVWYALADMLAQLDAQTRGEAT